MNAQENFNYIVEQFADLQLLRYQVTGFEDLTLRQKELVYYLSQAALEGRDILLTRTVNITCRFGNCWKQCMFLTLATDRMRSLRHLRSI